jgi:hypothetical protein
MQKRYLRRSGNCQSLVGVRPLRLVQLIDRTEKGIEIYREDIAGELLYTRAKLYHMMMVMVTSSPDLLSFDVLFCVLI